MLRIERKYWIQQKNLLQTKCVHTKCAQIMSKVLNLNLLYHNKSDNKAIKWMD